MRILLVDDENLQLMRLEDSVKKVLPGDHEYLCYTNPLIADKENEEIKVDIAFLDIEMPGINGVQLARKLKKVNPLINIIFVTAYNNYAIDAYKMHASGYLTKPVSEEKVREEIKNLRFPIELKFKKPLQIKCFGNFEVFYNGEPLKFQRGKSKELFAYLVDRQGAAVTVNELNAVLWEEDHKSYLRNLIADIKMTLKNIGESEVFIKRRNECFINPKKIYCDAYEYWKNNPDAIRMYRGEYMNQYPWADFKNNF